MDNFIEVNRKYNEGIIVDVYNNEIGLCLGNRSKEDNKVYKKWCYPQFKREPGAKAVPWSIPLGVKQEAIQRLTQLIHIIEGL